MPTTSHIVSLLINGVDRTSLLLRDSLYIRHTQNNDASVAEFSMKDGGSAYQPVGWHRISILINGVVVFGGFMMQTDAVSIGVGSTRQLNWQIQCKDWSTLLDGTGAIVEEKYTETSDAIIIADLFSTYLGDEGFDTGSYISSQSGDIDISFDKITVRDALNQLAERVNTTWYISPDKKIFWDIYNGFGVAPFNIDTVAPNHSTTFDVAYQSLRRQIDPSNIVNRVSVVGGNTEAGARQTDVFTGDGVTDTFGPLSKNVSSMWSAVYTIDSSTLAIYATNIGYEPQDRLAADGGTYAAIVNLQNGTIKIKSSLGHVPDNGTTVTVSYYYAVPVTTMLEHTGSQNYYDRVFAQTVYDENLTSIDSAEEYAQRVLNRYAFARETVSFDVYEHGLFPGSLIQINAPAIGLTNTRVLTALAGETDLTADYENDPNFDILLEDGSNSLEQESYGSNAVYLIQEVQIQPQVTSKDHFMMVAKISCGDRQHTIIDVIRQSPGFGIGAGPGRNPAPSSNGRLSNISSNLGEVVSGRALFTDGGSGAFSWSNYAGHTGAVVGLEDINSNTYGASYILDSGTVKAKMGRMLGMPALGTITPTGWGIYTTNGYFSGAVVAGTVDGSQILGGTITGGQITGGTITGGVVTGGTVSGALLTGGTANITVGNIGGFVVAANQLYSNGGTISTGLVVNSSNPGVIMGTAGLFGFGTLGLTFALYSDPARAPWFSSGTINNVVYEVYEAAVMRTSPDVFADGGIQIDSSGIFGVNPTTGAGALLVEDGNILTTEDDRAINFVGVNFMVDSTTGNMYAENGYFIGSVYATDGVFTGVVSASNVIGGTVSGATVIGGNIIGNTITGGTITGAAVVGISISGIDITGSNITGGTVSGALVLAGTVSGNLVSGGTVTGSQIIGGTVTGGLVTGGTVSGAQLTGGTITGARVTAGTITGVAVTSNTITSGTITGNLITGGTVTGAMFSAGTVTGGTITGGQINGGTVTGGLISGGTVQGAVIKSPDGASSVTTISNSGLNVKQIGFDILTVDGAVHFFQNVEDATNGSSSLGTYNHAFGAVCLKDQVNGLNYSLTIRSGVVTATVI